MTATLTVTNYAGSAPHSGRTFTVRIVRPGDTYGRNRALTFPRDVDRFELDRAARGDVLVEFYDARFAGAPGFDAEGQFVSRYYRSTLLDMPAMGGLDFETSVPEWTLDAPSLVRVLLWLEQDAVPSPS